MVWKCDPHSSQPPPPSPTFLSPQRRGAPGAHYALAGLWGAVGGGLYLGASPPLEGEGAPRRGHLRHPVYNTIYALINLGICALLTALGAGLPFE